MDAACGLVLSTARVGDRVIISARGELDFCSAPELIEEIDGAVDEGLSVCALDLEQVTFIDTEAIKSILLARRRLGQTGKELQVVACSPRVKRVISLLGLTEQIGFVADL